MDDPQKIRTCSYLLPDPGGEVVRDLLDELAKKDLVVVDLKLALDRSNDEARKDASMMFRAALTCRRGKIEVLAMREALVGLVRVAHHFCQRVEAGEVRSVRTYADFKEALEHPAVKRVVEASHG